MEPRNNRVVLKGFLGQEPSFAIEARSVLWGGYSEKCLLNVDRLHGVGYIPCRSAVSIL